MKKEKIRIKTLRESLRAQHCAGLPLSKPHSVSQLYGTVASLQEDEQLPSTAEDWASISYVHTNSAIGNGGMPAWVAEDAEQVLDGLFDTNIISERAIWFDKVGMRQKEDWPALATLNCLAVPVICVPPTRTIEYSRYQIPDRWDAPTFDFFTRIENLLRSCSACSSKCPMEFDSRLLNVAAALRAWPTNEAIIGASSRGAFISFSTLDRIRYTIAWYQVLLQLALDLGGYDSELLAKSVELYGNALFQPCSRCLAFARELVYEQGTSVNCHVLDDTLVALVMQANRFVLSVATDKEGLELWSLEGLYKSPGEGFLLRKNNSERLQLVARKFISQRSFEEIAANICRGRPGLASCFRAGDKWLCALILSNIHDYIEGFASYGDASFAEEHRAQLLKLLKRDRSFGELCFRDSTLEVEANRCIRSPSCAGSPGSVCFFNELSGILQPSSVGEFLRDRGFSESEIKEVLKVSERSFRRRIHIDGIALLCDEIKNGAVKDYGAESCGACFEEIPGHETNRRRHVLIGWKAKGDVEYADNTLPRDLTHEDIVYSFVTVDATDSSHVQSRGIFSRSNPQTCRTCQASYVTVEIEGSGDLLEIHVNRLLPVAATLGMVYDALSKCHEV